jgi:hypothetical protein
MKRAEEHGKYWHYGKYGDLGVFVNRDTAKRRRDTARTAELFGTMGVAER